MTMTERDAAIIKDIRAGYAPEDIAWKYNICRGKVGVVRRMMK